MLFIFAALLFTTWVLGVLTGTMFGGYIHLLPALAVLAVIARLIQTENTMN